MWSLLKKIKSTSSIEDLKLAEAISAIAGFSPVNLAPYRLATLHHSKAKEINGFKHSNERLEFLGDAVLGAVVTDYLFSKYPYKDEGFLSNLRSRIVNRESLNLLGKKIGINHILQYVRQQSQPSVNSMLGDTLEALVGAVYIDKGYRICKRFVVEKLIQPHYDLQQLATSTVNYKSKIIEWAQQQRIAIRFEVQHIIEETLRKQFYARVFLDDRPYGEGSGYTKKKATQQAAQETCDILGMD